MKSSPLKKIDLDRIENQWHFRGFSCGVWVDAPGQVWKDYIHDVDELFMVIAGNVELEIGKQVFNPPIGEEILIPAKVYHSVRNVGNTESRWLYGYKK